MSLHRECDAIMAARQSCAPATLKSRKKVIDIFLRKLSEMKITPRHLSDIHEHHIAAVVQHWRENNLSIDTILPRISVIRSFFKMANLDIEIPTNRQLNIQHIAKNLPVKELPKDVLEIIENSLVQNILAFEIYFGLTRKESICIDIRVAMVAALETDVLLIDRALAHNKKDRVIPVLTPEQKKAVNDRLEMLGDNIRLTEIHSEKKLQAMIASDLQKKGINPLNCLRQRYLQYRLPVLMKSFSKSAAMRRLRDEYGVSSKRYLRRGS